MTEGEPGGYKLVLDEDNHREVLELVAAAVNAELGTDLPIEQTQRIATAVFSALYATLFDSGQGLLGVSEVGSKLGVSKQRAHQLHQAGRLPHPFATVGRGRPVWLAAEIEQVRQARDD